MREQSHIDALISEEYRALNRELHYRIPAYGNGAHKWAPKVRELANQNNTSSILDYGAGKRTLAQALPEFKLSEYDPAVPGIDTLPGPADIVCCLDVLEHVEPDKIDYTLAYLVSLTRKVLVLSISCKLSTKMLADGRSSHILVESPEWWRNKLQAFGTLEELDSPKDAQYDLLLRPFERAPAES